MATIGAALIAAVVATTGYMVTVRAKLREERAKRYAEALAALVAYQALPYQIRRRPDSSAATRNALGIAITDIQHQLDFHRRLLDLDSRRLGREYFALVDQARRPGKPDRDKAWSNPPAGTDEAMSFSERYSHLTDEQMEFCLAQMRRHLRLLPIPFPKVSLPAITMLVTRGRRPDR